MSKALITNSASRSNGSSHTDTIEMGSMTFAKQNEIYETLLGSLKKHHRNREKAGIVCLLYHEKSVTCGVPFVVKYDTNFMPSLDVKMFESYEDAQACAWNLVHQLAKEFGVQNFTIRDFVKEYAK